MTHCGHIHTHDGDVCDYDDDHGDSRGGGDHVDDAVECKRGYSFPYLPELFEAAHVSEVRWISFVLFVFYDCVLMDVHKAHHHHLFCSLLPPDNHDGLCSFQGQQLA